MSLYNHAAIWEDSSKWPRSFYCNGWILIDGKKMSKSEGNFFTIDDIVEKFGADASRFACAEAGDSMEDANFMIKNADEAILKLSNIDMSLEKMDLEKLRSE
jgi:leucyl-tRNA synthetase